jgi:transposase
VSDVVATTKHSRGAPASSTSRQSRISARQSLQEIVFQYLQGFSGAQAAEAVRSRIDWKYALGLGLEDYGFDASVLSEFRSHLLTDMPGVFMRVAEVFGGIGNKWGTIRQT